MISAIKGKVIIMKKIFSMTLIALAALIAANAGNSWAKRAQAVETAYEARRTAQEIKPVLFQNVDTAMAAAKEQIADLLAPKTFDEGLKRYQEAEKRFENGEKLAAICIELNAALASFQKAQEASKLAKVAFASALDARAEAQKAAAPKFSTATWHSAEEKLRKTARTLEEGHLNAARKNVAAVEKQYRQAEREAVAQNPLAWNRRRSAGKMSEPQPAIEKPADASTASRDAINVLQQKVEKLEQALAGKNGTQAEIPQGAPQAAARRETMSPLNRLFNQNEGAVLKRGNDLVIRIYGLDFAESAASLEPRQVYLLDKVRQALEMLPAESITIEGHTYLFGAVDDNLKHSREKAEAVKSYLKGNLSRARAAIVAIGYGNTSPLPNRRPANGHAGNNRVDIVIHLGSGATS
jgi:outer membrane protein OmpA-like peptidoglycan-associated protein